jgi:hypothetical protein
MNESHRGMVKHILRNLTAKIITELRVSNPEATPEAKTAYVGEAAAEEFILLLSKYDVKVVKEAMRLWEIELNALLFLLDLFATFKWEPIRRIGIVWALVWYGTEGVMNALKLGESVGSK